MCSSLHSAALRRERYFRRCELTLVQFGLVEPHLHHRHERRALGGVSLHLRPTITPGQLRIDARTAALSGWPTLSGGSIGATVEQLTRGL